MDKKFLLSVVLSLLIICGSSPVWSATFEDIPSEDLSLAWPPTYAFEDDTGQIYFITHSTSDAAAVPNLYRYSKSGSEMLLADAYEITDSGSSDARLFETPWSKGGPKTVYELVKGKLTALPADSNLLPVAVNVRGDVMYATRGWSTVCELKLNRNGAKPGPAPDFPVHTSAATTCSFSFGQLADDGWALFELSEAQGTGANTSYWNGVFLLNPAENVPLLVLSFPSQPLVALSPSRTYVGPVFDGYTLNLRDFSQIQLRTNGTLYFFADLPAVHVAGPNMKPYDRTRNGYFLGSPYGVKHIAIELTGNNPNIPPGVLTGQLTSPSIVATSENTWVLSAYLSVAATTVGVAHQQQLAFFSKDRSYTLLRQSDAFLDGWASVTASSLFHTEPRISTGGDFLMSYFVTNVDIDYNEPSTQGVAHLVRVHLSPAPQSANN